MPPSRNRAEINETMPGDNPASWNRIGSELIRTRRMTRPLKKASRALSGADGGAGVENRRGQSGTDEVGKGGQELMHEAGWGLSGFSYVAGMKGRKEIPAAAT